MSATITKTLKVKLNNKLTTELCDDFEIPYVYCRIRLHYKTKEKIIEGVPKGVMELTYAQAMEHNATITDPLFRTHINIILKNCEGADKVMVIDIDDKEDSPLAFELFGEYFKTKSSRKGLPHLWRLKKGNDYSTDVTGIEINGKKTKIDLRYTNIFECADSKIEYIGDLTSMTEFDFETYHPKPMDEKPVPREPREPSASYTELMDETAPEFKRFIHHLRHIEAEHISNGDSWLKNGFAIKRVFGSLDNEMWFDILVQWSQRSPLHRAEDTEPWRKRFEAESKCGIPTILHYSKLSGEEEYNAIEKEYRDAVKQRKREELQPILNEGKRRLMEAVREYDEEQAKENALYPDYESVKEQFEKKYALIKRSSCYLEQTDNGVKFYNATNFNTSHKMLKYYEMVKNKQGVYSMVAEKFVSRWVEDPTLRQYDYCDYFPPPLTDKCPKNVFNMWQPFYVETLKGDYIKNDKAIEMFKNHIDILCNHQKEITEYVLMFLGQMLLYPAIKSIALTLISKEGAGKGTLMDWLKLVMGEKKIFESCMPSRDVWGSHNPLMVDAFLVNLNELSRKETMGAEGHIKALTTDASLPINPKGVDAFVIKFYGRLIITTQNEDPITTKTDDRRNLICKSSNELCKSINPNVVEDYFNPLRKEIESETGMRSIYDYLINLKGLDSFINLPIPKTVYQNEMKDANRSYYDRWLDDYVRDYPNDKDTEIELPIISILELVTSYFAKRKIAFETNSIKIGLALSRLKTDLIPNGMKRKDEDRMGSPYVFNLPLLRKHYKIGWLGDAFQNE